MTRRELTAAVAEYLTHQGSPVTEKAVDAVIVASLEVIEDVAKQHKHLDLRGFGRFYGRMSARRTYVNPRKPAEHVTIPPRLELRFSASPALRERINQA